VRCEEPANGSADYQCARLIGHGLSPWGYGLTPPLVEVPGRVYGRCHCPGCDTCAALHCSPGRYEMTEPFGHYAEMQARVNIDRTVRSICFWLVNSRANYDGGRQVRRPQKGWSLFWSASREVAQPMAYAFNGKLAGRGVA